VTQDLLLKIGSVVLLLGGLIFVHELGHFLVAKWLDVKVVRFSVGFGPRLLGFTRGETEYRLAALPLGGYVKMAGDDPGAVPLPEDQGRGFLEQSPFRRFLIAVAGPAANLVFPFLVYLAIGLLQNGSPVPGPVVGTVSPGSPAAEAGLQPGDRILAVAPPGGPERTMRWFADLREAVAPHPGETLTVRIERNGQRLAPLTIVPASEKDQNPVETTYRGIIGVTAAFAPPWVAPVKPGAAGPLQPFDLVVRAGGKPVRHLAELEKALAAAACAPVELEVMREQPAAAPDKGAAPRWAPVQLAGVPSCVEGKPALVPADPTLTTLVGRVAPGSPAEEAGLRRGDAIAAVNGKPVRSFRDVNAHSGEFRAGKPVALALADGRTLTLTPREREEKDGLTGESTRRLVLGFQPPTRPPLQAADLVAELVPLRLGVAEIARHAADRLWEVVRLTVLGIGRIVTGQISFKTVGGPIMLFSIAAQAADEGWEAFFFTMALISVNLGLMNLLPIPVLDGGHIAACTLEAVTRRRPSVRSREIANLIGLALLALLMIAVFKNDIARLMG